MRPRAAAEKSFRPVSWLSFTLLSRLPVLKGAVTSRDFVPNTVAGPRRFFTGFPNTETRKSSIAVHYTLPTLREQTRGTASPAERGQLQEPDAGRPASEPV